LRIAELQVQGDGGTDRAGDEIGHALDQAGHIDGRGLEGLASGEGQQTMHQGSRPLRRFQGALDQALFAVAADPPPHQEIQGAQDGGQQIVEIVRHAARELAHGLQLLSLDERLLGLGQGPLVLEPLGDVRGELERPDPLAGVVGQASELDLVVRPYAGGVPPGFDDREFLSGDRARPDGAHGRLVLGLVGQEVEDVVSDLGPATVESLAFFNVRSVDGEEAIVGVQGHDQYVGPFDQAGQEVALTGAQLRQGLKLVAGALQDQTGLDDVFDVGAGAVPAGHAALRVALRLAARQHPAIVAQSTPHPVFALKRLLGLAGPPPGGQGAGAIFRMNPLAPSLAVACADRRAGVGVPARVMVVAGAVGGGGPDKLRHRIGKQAKPGFALGDGVFRLHLKGNVDVDAVPVGDGAVGVEGGADPRQERPQDAICAADRKHHLEGLSRRNSGFPLFQYVRKRFQVMDRLPSPAAHVRRCFARVFVPSPIVPRDVSTAVGDPAKRRNVIGQSAKLAIGDRLA
jgi:hypothetical protein